MLLTCIHKRITLPSAAHASFNRTGTEHDNKLVVLKRMVVATIAAGFTVRIVGRTHQLTITVRTVIRQVSSGQIQQTANWARAPDAHGHARSVLQIHGLIAIRLANTLHFASNGVKSFIP